MHDTECCLIREYVLISRVFEEQQYLPGLSFIIHLVLSKPNIASHIDMRENHGFAKFQFWLIRFALLTSQWNVTAKRDAADFPPTSVFCDGTMHLPLPENNTPGVFWQNTRFILQTSNADPRALETGSGYNNVEHLRKVWDSCLAKSRDVCLLKQERDKWYSVRVFAVFSKPSALGKTDWRNLARVVTWSVHQDVLDI